jgi:hypothetical protein
LNMGSCPVAGRPIRFSGDFTDFIGIFSTFCRTLYLTKCFTFSTLEGKLQHRIATRHECQNQPPATARKDQGLARSHRNIAGASWARGLDF